MADGGAIMAAFRAGSNTLLTRLFVMTGEVRLVGEWTPNLPEAAAMAAVAASDCGPSVVDRLGAVRLKTVCW
ncbi:YcjX family protein [Thalassospira xiamenensis]|uniref:YcjX family protein n=1 Tax=Thalassospira xiamenensis TaxID=220697 RepID=UPI0011BDB73E|nr:YcjX family protein [Thalassospira xiamenensis]